MWRLVILSKHSEIVSITNGDCRYLFRPDVLIGKQIHKEENCFLVDAQTTLPEVGMCARLKVVLKIVDQNIYDFIEDFGLKPLVVGLDIFATSLFTCHVF